MVAPKRGMNIFGRTNWREIVTGLDWNRIVIEAKGYHLSHTGEEDICGACIVKVLTTDYDIYSWY